MIVRPSHCLCFFAGCTVAPGIILMDVWLLWASFGLLIIAGWCAMEGQ